MMGPGRRLGIVQDSESGWFRRVLGNYTRGKNVVDLGSSTSKKAGDDGPLHNAITLQLQLGIRF